MIKYFSKLFVFVPVLFLPSNEAKGQEYWTRYEAGPILKLASARMSSDNDLVLVPADDGEVGYQFGGFFRINVDNIYVQAEVFYSKI